MKKMAKKIELNKQTLRTLTAEEMEAVAGGVIADTTDELPVTPSGCHTRTDVCGAALVSTDPTAPDTTQ
jgi:hypothetical protein